MCNLKINVTDLLLKVRKTNKQKKEYMVSVRDFFRTCLLFCVFVCGRAELNRVRVSDFYSHITKDS